MTNTSFMFDFGNIDELSGAVYGKTIPIDDDTYNRFLRAVSNGWVVNIDVIGTLPIGDARVAGAWVIIQKNNGGVVSYVTQAIDAMYNAGDSSYKRQFTISLEFIDSSKSVAIGVLPHA